MGMKRFQMMILTMDDDYDGSTEFNKYFWRTVLEFLSNSYQFDLRVRDWQTIVNFLISSLKRYGCTDANMIRDIIRTCTCYCDLDFNAPSSFPFFATPSVIIHFPSESFNQVIYYKDELTHTDSMDTAIETANEEFAMCLVKYGLYSRENMNLRNVEEIVDLFVKIWSRINRNLLGEIAYREASDTIVMEFLKYISRKHPEFPEKRPEINVYFILKIIKAVILKMDDEPITQQYVNCLKLFYRIIPEPYIPRDDVKELLRFLLKFADSKEEIIEKYITTYVELIGVENTITYTPRSLKHLARCVIRNEIIRSSNTVEKSLTYFCLPETLKHLLLGASE